MKMLYLSLFVIVALGVGIAMQKNSVPQNAEPTAQPSEPTATQVEAEVEVAAKKNALEVPPPANPKPESSKLAIASLETWQRFAHKQELHKYAELGNKALLLEHDRVLKRKLMKDQAFLQSLKPLVLAATHDPVTVELQNAALDFLFEALKGENKAAAVEILKSVVADASIENSTEDMDVRKSLAGVKAEVLFNWSSLDPDANPMIDSSLPGPVSEKIWANVQKQQSNNLAESMTFQNSDGI